MPPRWRVKFYLIVLSVVKKTRRQQIQLSVQKNKTKQCRRKRPLRNVKFHPGICPEGLRELERLLTVLPVSNFAPGTVWIRSKTGDHLVRISRLVEYLIIWLKTLSLRKYSVCTEAYYQHNIRPCVTLFIVIKVKLKQSNYRPGEAQRFPGS